MASLGHCPTLLAVLLAGCASSEALEAATRNAQACEYTREQVQADANALRAQSLSSDDDRRAWNAQAWANKIAVDCRLLRDQVAIEQARIDTAHTNRMAAAGALKAWGDGVAGAYDDKRVSCTSRTVGSTVYTDCR